MKILLVDDDPILTRHYAEALGVQGFDVSVLRTASEAFHFPISDFDLCVCDLMMEDQGFFDNQGTKNGLITGLRLVESWREKGESVPCVILTNLNIDPVFDELQDSVERLTDVVVMKKAEFDPREFSQVALHLIRRESIPSLSPTFGKRLARSLILQPNFAGLGIDLKLLLGFKKSK